MSSNFDEDNGTVIIDGVTFALNLIWSMADTRAEFRSMLKTEAEQFGTNLYCKLPLADGAICYGLADESMGYKRGMPVLPAIIAAKVPVSLLGIWPLQDDTWYILAIDALGIITVDKTIPGEEAAFDNFSSILRSMDWENVSCPEEWALPERTETLFLEDLIKEKKIKIQTIKFRPEKMHILAAALCICIITFAVKFFVYPQQHHFIVHQFNSAVKKHNVFPASKSLLPEDFIVSCKSEVYNKTIYASSISGYAPESAIRCTNTGVIFSLHKRFGSKDYLNNKIKNTIHNAGGKLNILSGNSAELIFPLKGREVGDIQALTTLPAQKESLQTMFENTFLPINLSDERDCGATSTDEVSYDREFTSYDFQVQFDYNPEILIPLLSKSKNIVINEIIYDSSNYSWSVSGTSYGIK